MASHTFTFTDFFAKAEKATIALYRYHPELKTCWGDLEKKPVSTPTPGVQPKELKIKLLPFQLESLTWMRKQEDSVWTGGMLADEMGFVYSSTASYISTE